MERIVLLLSLIIFMGGCQSEQIKEESHEASGHFDYTHQDEWQFESGKMQSPININVSESVPMSDIGDLTFDFNHDITYVEDNGHSIQIGASGSSTINGRPFTLKQVHFHSESEHTLNEDYYPLEAHFVHESQDGRLAVVAVLFKEGEPNESFEDVLNHVVADNKNEQQFSSDLSLLLPENKSYYHYLGSLTTPPLTENVEWYIFSQQVEVSSEQLEQFQQYYHDNYREVQPTNDRTILYHEA